MKRGNYVVGAIFILLGIAFLLSNMGIIDINFSQHWPLTLLIPGLLFELGYFIKRKDPGLLVPGGMFTTYGALFYINILYGWHWMAYLWPLFPLGVAIGLFQLYLFSEREALLLVPVGIIGGFSLVALTFTLSFWNISLVISIILILIGLIIIFRKK